MAKSKKITVKAVTTFFDKKKKVRRNKNDEFEVTDKRLNEIRKFEKENNLELITIVADDKPKESESEQQ